MFSDKESVFEIVRSEATSCHYRCGAECPPEVFEGQVLYVVVFEGCKFFARGLELVEAGLDKMPERIAALSDGLDCNIRDE